MDESYNWHQQDPDRKNEGLCPGWPISRSIDALATIKRPGVLPPSRELYHKDLVSSLPQESCIIKTWEEDTGGDTADFHLHQSNLVSNPHSDIESIQAKKPLCYTST